MVGVVIQFFGARAPFAIAVPVAAAVALPVRPGIIHGIWSFLPCLRSTAWSF